MIFLSPMQTGMKLEASYPMAAVDLTLCIALCFIIRMCFP